MWRNVIWRIHICQNVIAPKVRMPSRIFLQILFNLTFFCFSGEKDHSIASSKNLQQLLMWWGLIYIKLTYDVLIAYQIKRPYPNNDKNKFWNNSLRTSSKFCAQESQHNDIQHNDTKHVGLTCDSLQPIRDSSIKNKF
jgi:hypothetical protein